MCEKQTKPKTLVNSLDPTGQAFMDIITDGLCTNCTILTGGTRTVFEDGSDAGPPQGVYIHRVISIGTFMNSVYRRYTGDLSRALDIMPRESNIYRKNVFQKHTDMWAFTSRCLQGAKPANL